MTNTITITDATTNTEIKATIIERHNNGNITVMTKDGFEMDCTPSDIVKNTKIAVTHTDKIEEVEIKGFNSIIEILKVLKNTKTAKRAEMTFEGRFSCKFFSTSYGWSAKVTYWTGRKTETEFFSV